MVCVDQTRHVQEYSRLHGEDKRQETRRAGGRERERENVEDTMCLERRHGDDGRGDGNAERAGVVE